MGLWSAMMSFKKNSQKVAAAEPSYAPILDKANLLETGSRQKQEADRER